MGIKKLAVFGGVVLFFIFLAIFYPKITGFFAEKPERVKVNVTGIIDGDTIEITEGKIRLRGINAPEKNQIYFEEAKEVLEYIDGEEIEIEDYGQDKYGRNLSYIFYKNMFMNKKLLEKGLAHLYYYEQDRHFAEMKKAEEKARQEEIGIWKKSENYGCIELIEFEFTEPEKIVLNNNCKKMNVVLKDDATHIYSLELEKGIFEKNFSHIWNDAGDSVYIWDEKGLLFWKRY